MTPSERVALVVGGSGGIGAAVAGALADDGLAVVSTWRSEEPAPVASITAMRCDVTEPDALAALVADVRARFGRLDTLAWCAGPTVEQRYVSQLDDARWARAFAVETDGFLRATRAALPLLREHGGSVVAISSAALSRHVKRDILSAAPKAAIEALIRAIAVEEGRFGVRANAVRVGVVQAGMFERLVGDELDARWLHAAKANIPLGRFGTAREVADVVAFLASDRAGYVSGQIVGVDGGFGA